MRRNAGIADAIPQRVDADLVLLAGDIANGADGVRWAAEHFPGIPVAYVLGNHEAYGHELISCHGACRQAAQGTSVRVLELETWDALPGIRVIGASLWTSFALWGMDSVLDAEVEALRMSDFHTIRAGDRNLTPADTRRMHHHTREWIERELLRARTDGVTAIVLTHHAPHPLCLGEHYVRVRDPLSAAFASDLKAILTSAAAPAFWCSGHTHTNRVVQVRGTMLASNQAGYRWMGECADYRHEGLLLRRPGP